MLTPSARTLLFPVLADLPHRLGRVAAVRGETPGPGPSPSPAGGVVQRWLSDPAGLESDLLAGLHAIVSDWWATWYLLVLTVAVGLAAARVGLGWWRARSWRAARDDGRWLQVVPPAATTTDQGVLVWRGLVGLLRPGRLRRHLRLIGWEVHTDGHRLVAGLWLPSTVDAGQVGRAVTAGYPRARLRAGGRGQHAAPTGLAIPRPARAGGRGRGQGRPVSVGYLVVPASMWAPLLADPQPSRGTRGGGRGEATGDGLRMAYQALASTPVGYRAVLQILVRPLPPGTARAAGRVRRAGGGPPGPGLPARGLLAALDLAQATARAGLDLAVPGPPPARTGATRRAPATRAGGGVDAVTAQAHRDALTRASSELVEVCARVVVSGPDRTACRAKAFEIVNALQVATAQRLHAVRVHSHAWATAAGREPGNWRAVGPLAAGAGHRRGWLVARPDEVGGLARFPHQPAVYRFDAATAPHLPAPTGIPVLPYPEHGHDEYDGEAA